MYKNNTKLNHFQILATFNGPRLQNSSSAGENDIKSEKVPQPVCVSVSTLKLKLSFSVHFWCILGFAEYL